MAASLAIDYSTGIYYMRSFEDASAEDYYNLRREIGIQHNTAWKFAGHVALALSPTGAIYADLRAPEPDAPARQARIEIQCQQNRLGVLITPARSRRPPGLVAPSEPLYDVSKGSSEKLLCRVHPSVEQLAYLAVVSEDEGAGIIPVIAEEYALPPVGRLGDARLMIGSAVARVKGREATISTGLALPLAARHLFSERSLPSL
jgi:hypothetical protein